MGSADVTLTSEYVKEETGYDITPQITEKSGAPADGPSGEEAGLPLAAKILIGAGAAVVVLAVFAFAVARCMPL